MFHTQRASTEFYIPALGPQDNEESCVGDDDEPDGAMAELAEPRVDEGQAQVTDDDGHLCEGRGDDEDGLDGERDLSSLDHLVPRQVPHVAIPAVTV